MHISERDFYQRHSSGKSCPLLDGLFLVDCQGTFHKVVMWRHWSTAPTDSGPIRIHLNQEVFTNSQSHLDHVRIAQNVNRRLKPREESLLFKHIRNAFTEKKEELVRVGKLSERMF